MSDTTWGSIKILACDRWLARQVRDLIRENIWDDFADNDSDVLLLGESYDGNCRAGITYELADELAKLGVTAIIREDPIYEYSGSTYYIRGQEVEPYTSDGEGRIIITERDVVEAIRRTTTYTDLVARLAPMVGMTPLVRELDALAGQLEDEPTELAIPSPDEQEAHEQQTLLQDVLTAANARIAREEDPDGS